MRSKYISKFIVLTSIILMSIIRVFGQNQDSIKTIEMKEVMVSANKTEKPFVELTVPAKIISKEEIESSGHSRLDEIISEQVGVVTVPGFGGSEGIQLQGIDPEYTLILIDGLPIIGRVAGILDLSRISLGSVERIEIVKGASSSLYGSEALGGVVNIITNKAKNEGLSKKEVFVLSARQMSVPVIASTSTTLAAFFPLVFWPGIAGEFMFFLPVTLLAVLTSSLTMALIFIPVVGKIIGNDKED